MQGIWISKIELPFSLTNEPKEINLFITFTPSENVLRRLSSIKKGIHARKSFSTYIVNPFQVLLGTIPWKIFSRMIEKVFLSNLIHILEIHLLLNKVTCDLNQCKAVFVKLVARLQRSSCQYVGDAMNRVLVLVQRLTCILMQFSRDYAV